MSNRDGMKRLTTQLRDFLLRSLPGRADVDVSLRRRIDAAIRRELDAPGLQAGESLTGSGTSGAPSTEALDALIGARVQRALLEGMSVASSEGALEGPPAPPDVRVSRAKGEGEKALAQPDGELLLTLSSVHDSGEVVEIDKGLGSLTDIVRNALLADAPARPLPDAHPDVEDLQGHVLGGKYRILAKKGEGAFGTVYEAVDNMLGAQVAVKVLKKKAARSQGSLREFLQEAKRITTLDHENIVRWITFDKTAEGLHYFVMEYLSGEELQKLLTRENTLEPERVANILLQTLAALRAAHESTSGTLLHLDLKPANLFVQPGEPEKVKVIDFGIGQHVGAEAIAAEQEADSYGLAGLVGDCANTIATVSTASPVSANGVKRARGGTIIYASPEQCRHLMGAPDIEELDGRSDLYSLGVMAFKMLTGKFPFDSWKSAEEGFDNHLEKAPLKVGQAGVKVPRKLAAFVDRCLAKKPDARWRDAREAYEAMDAIVHPPAVWKMGVGVAALLIMAGALSLTLLMGDSNTLPLVLQQRLGDAFVNLSREPVYMGSERLSREFKAPGMEAGWKSASARLAVADLGGEPGETLVGWTPTVIEGGVRLDAAPDAQQLPDQVVIELRPDSGTPQRSFPFQLVFLGSDSWTLEQPQVPGLGLMALDPDRQTLQIPVTGRSEDIARVEVIREGNSHEARLSDGSAGLNLLYSLSLDDLDLADGSTTLDVRVVDRAGREGNMTVKIDVVSSELRLESVPELTGCSFTGSEWSVGPTSEAVLVLKMNRPAALRWELFDDSSPDTPFAGHVDAPLREHRIRLPFAAHAEQGSLQRFEGRVELTLDDAQLVFHAAGAARGKPRSLADVRFAYSAEVPVFDLRVKSGTDGGIILLTEAGVHYLRQVGARLVIEREDTSVPVRYEVHWGRLGSQPSGMLERKLLGRQPSAEFPLDVQGDGVYELLVRAFRHEASTEEDIGNPVVQGPFKIVMDSDAPQLRLVPPAERVVLRAADDTPSRWLVEVQDVPLPGGHETPVRLRWRVVGGAVNRPTTGRWNDLPELGTPSAGALLQLPAPATLVQGTSARSRDGAYSLELQGTDDAGNEGASTEHPFVVSTEAPRLDLVRPDGLRPWNREMTTRKWEIEVYAVDPNGTELVRGTLVAVDRPAMSLPIELEPRREPGGSTWSGNVELNHTWSGLDVLLKFTAVDGEGTTGSAPSPYRITLGHIDRNMPPRIEVYAIGRSSGPMSRVSGNEGRAYELGGRGDQEEQDAFSEHGLGHYKAASGSTKSWQVVYAAGEIPDYYLDTQEVTEAEFLEFVRSPSGAANAEHWAAGAASADRLGQLEQRLEASVVAAGNLPVTGVSFDEAAAYAHWVGKRLPSLTEWEYAVRDGASYRLYASFEPGVGAPALDQLNVARRGAAGSVWPVDAGSDLCQVSGLRNLCSNVAEWTTSPTAFVLPGSPSPANTPAHMRAHGPELLASGEWAGAAEFWVAGGSFRSRAFVFSSVEGRERDRPSSAVGFRCALSESAVIGMMDSPDPAGHRIQKLE
jgi:serine/threonine protein kinase/formylglycine-generating enzyme required for sulfatase activity